MLDKEGSITLVQWKMMFKQISNFCHVVDAVFTNGLPKFEASPED